MSVCVCESMVCGDYCFPVVKERESEGLIFIYPALSQYTDSTRGEGERGAHQLTLMS